MSKTILLIGYQPFDRFTYNPSEVIATALDGLELGKGYAVRGVSMPVDCEVMPNKLASLWQQYQPAICIGLGLAYGITGIRLERYGHNYIEITNPDNGGHTRPGVPIITDAPAAYLSPLPFKELTAALLNEGIPAFISDHAGAHLCNMMLYTALHQAAKLPPAQRPQSGFIHLPTVPQVVAQLNRTDKTTVHTASMSLELMQQAVKLALAFLAKS